MKTLLASIGLFLSANWVTAQLPASPKPAAFQVKIRYDINASRDQHVILYDRLIGHLKSLGFKFTPPLEQHPKWDRENPSKNDLSGIIAGDKVLAILQDPSVATMMLVPEGFNVPPGDQPVLVRLQLAGGLPLQRQRELRNQTLAMLQEQGFRESFAYDTRGYDGSPQTRLMGTILAGQLELLLKDLRRQPTGWLAPLMLGDELPLPVRNITPVVVVEVLADPMPPADPAAPEPREQEFLQKISAELWNLVKQPEKAGEAVRVQMILSYRPQPTDDRWRQSVTLAAPSLFIEGQLSQVITGFVRAGEVARLAALPEISVIRMPHAPVVQADPTVRGKSDLQAIREQSGVDGLHKAGHRGKGVRIAIIDSDFRGWDSQLKARRLPPATRLIDLTAAQDRDINPLPMDGDGIGHGTHCALAAAAAAPQAELILVRTTAAAPYQFQNIFDFVQERPIANDLQRRQDEIFSERGRLRSQRAELVRERKFVLENFEEDFNNEREFGFLGVVRGWVFSERYWHYQRMDYQQREERIVEERQARLTRLLSQVLSLKGTQIVVSALGWNSGYPMGGISPLSRYFDERLGKQPLWFQSAGNIKGQCWHGFYRDDNLDGAMEFLPPGTKLPPGRWSSEINFLAWQPYDKDAVADLPAGARVRVSVQWREPHEAEHAVRLATEDVYAKPLADLRLYVLRQRDPDAKNLPADAFELVAYSSGLPQRLDNQPASATYEINAEFTAAQPGRYAIRLERQGQSQWILLREEDQRPRLKLLENLTSVSTQPLGETIIPGLARTWELYPRFFVEAIDDDTSKLGRPLFADYATDFGALGTPADARRVIAVGACDLKGRPQPYTPLGPLMNRQLAEPPLVLMYDDFDVTMEGGPAFGASLATPFAAGMAASALSAGVSPEQFFYQARQRSGKVLQIGR